MSVVPNTHHHHHPQRDIDTVVHGDDFVAVAEDGQLDHFEQVLENSIEIKRVRRIGPGRWEADPKLTEKLNNMPNLREGKGATTPGGKDIGKDDRDFDCELEFSDAKLVQAATGLELYIALDRPDIAYSVKIALQHMSKPAKLMHLRVVRVARYFKNNPRLMWKFPYQQQPKSIDTFVDADFAARKTMLRSILRQCLEEAHETTHTVSTRVATFCETARCAVVGPFHVVSKCGAHNPRRQPPLAWA